MLAVRALSDQRPSVTEKRIGYISTLLRKQQLRDGYNHLSGTQVRLAELAAALHSSCPRATGTTSPWPHLSRMRIALEQSPYYIQERNPVKELVGNFY